MSDTLKRGAIESFTMKGTPLLATGITTEPLALSHNLWLHAKVYSAGGENELHYHLEEDHAFFVLQGQATFEDENGVELPVGPMDGVLLKKGVRYRFQSSSSENLVMIRVGGGQRTPEELEEDEAGPYPRPMTSRRRTDGSHFPGDDPANRTGAEPASAIPGAFFGT